MNNAYDFWAGTLIVSYVVTLQFKCSYLATIGDIFTISVLKSVYNLRHEYFTFHVSVSRYSLIPKYVYSVISHTLVDVFLRLVSAQGQNIYGNCIQSLYFFMFMCRGMMMARSLSRN